MLLLAAVNGEGSLRGMWLWGRGAWERIAEPPGLWGTLGPPAYGRVWGLLAGIDSEELSRALCGEGDFGELSRTAMQEEGAYTVDGKVLRGSRRGVAAALQVVTAAGQSCRIVLGQ
jgi:hypothetical protein